VFAAEVMVPAGLELEGVEHLCWLCAHYVTEHGAKPETAGLLTCSCPREEIYPDDVLMRLGPPNGPRICA